MKQFVCAVKDRASNLFGRPFFVPSLGNAMRDFADEINRQDKDNSLYKHPDDFDLYELATFDDVVGKFVSLDEIKLLSLGKQVKISSEK